MLKQRLTLAILTSVFLFTAADVSGYEKNLRDNFKNPPRQYSLFPFWAWNDTLEPDKLRWQIDQMVDKNVYGAFMHARVGINKGKTPYFSKGWWRAVDTAVEHGRKAGFYPWLYDEDKWPSGSAGGRTVAANPEEFSQKGLKYSRMEIEGPQNVKLPAVDKLLAVIAARVDSRGRIKPKSLMDISNFSAKKWSVPEGKWAILTFWQIKEEVPRGIDYLDKEAVATFINNTYEEYYKRFGQYFGGLVPGIFFDEISAKLAEADFAWTDDFLEKFREIKGYDLKKYLPLLVYDGGDITPKIRCDYYDVFTSLYEDAWFKQISSWCEEHNLPWTGHSYEDIFSYATQGDYFRTFSHLQIPLTDNEEFRYSFPAYIEWFKPKQLASIAHINNRKLAGAEALGGNGWAYTLEELRYGLSMLSVYGLNFMVLHGLYYTIDTPLTSSDFPPSWFYQNPHWKYFGQVGKFAQRILYMGSQGNHVCDVAILYPITTQWASGRNVHGDGLGKKYTIDEFKSILSFQYYNIQQALLDNQIDFDIIDPASFLKTDVSNGKIKIAREKYSVLILPPLSVIKTDVLQKIKSFYENGGTVIALNTLPKASMEKGGKDPVIMGAINDIFGFNPLFLRSGYFEIDKTYSEKFITNVNTEGGKAYFTKAIKDAISIVQANIDKDIFIKEGNPNGLSFIHKTAGPLDIYHFMNGQRLPRTWKISFRTSGAIEKWHPETGKIEQIYGISDNRGRTELNLKFAPWETYYIVFDTANKQTANASLDSTNLKDAKITDIKGNRIIVEGYESPKVDSFYVNVVAGLPSKQVNKVCKGENSLSELELTGQWSFVPAGEALDYKWQPAIEQSRIELPVMGLYVERKGDSPKIEELLKPDSKNIYFKQIKIKDNASKVKGCGRYLSSWDGWWITYADLKPHWGRIGGDEIRFTKKIVVGDVVKDAWLDITAGKKYQLYINGKAVGADNNWENSERYEIARFLNKGVNLFEVVVNGTPVPLASTSGGDTDTAAFVAQGRILLNNGQSVKFVSDRTWNVCDKAGIWTEAFEYVNPPLGPWGSVKLEKEPVSFPVTIWYRQQLPAGATGMIAPVIKGDFQIFVNGKEVEIKPGQKLITFGKLLNDKKNILLIKIDVVDHSEGLIEPVMVYCKPVKVELELWKNYGLDWYSGRCVYSKQFSVPDEYLDDDTKLVLDLGGVKYFAEIWINDKLVTTRIWPPFEMEIQSFLRPAKNNVNIVVANLIANKAKWNTFDQSLTTLRARWGHELNILRRPDILDSGLLGPVKIIPLKKTTLEVLTD